MLLITVGIRWRNRPPMQLTDTFTPIWLSLQFLSWSLNSAWFLWLWLWLLKTQLQTDMFRNEKKNHKSHRRSSYNSSKNTCKDWNSIVSVGKLFVRVISNSIYIYIASYLKSWTGMQVLQVFFLQDLQDLALLQLQITSHNMQ